MSHRTASRLLSPGILTSLVLVLLALAVGPGPLAPRKAAAGEATARALALTRGLKTRRLAAVRFEQADLNEVVRWLRIATGYNIVIKRLPLAKAGIEWEDLRFDVVLDDVSVQQLLEVLLEPHGLAWKASDNVLYITSHADALGKPVTRLYSISHITYTKTDFIAPEINLRPSDFVPVDEYEPERPVEDDPLNSGDAVAELLREVLGSPDDWDNDGWAITANDRYLVVRCPAAMHEKVRRALNTIASMK